jgi:hypothetical protein
MSGSDVYESGAIASGDWSSAVVFTPAQGDTPATIKVTILAAEPASLSGTVSETGDLVTLTVAGGGSPFQEQLEAVCDITNGSVFMDEGGDYFLFSSQTLTNGATYKAVDGYGYFDGQPTCFAAGTRIETERGPVAVETLRRGDRVRTVLRGRSAPVIWIGHRRVICTGHPWPPSVWPVRIAAGAFGPGQPGREVHVSPEHAVFVDRSLVPVRHLLNDATIAQLPTDCVTYWHVELPAHDVLLADGLPVESFLDTGNRDFFSDNGEITRLGVAEGDSIARQAWDEKACAPLLDDPQKLAVIRRRLRQLAGTLGQHETGDSALELNTGTTPIPRAWDGTVATATLPVGLRLLHLSSRTAVPWQQVDGSIDERRLGVAVTRIRLDDFELGLDDGRLVSGWHPLEAGLRWTRGQATIALPPSRRPIEIEIRTAPMLRYWEPDRADKALAA